jgi:hypothetical protein
MVNEGFRKPCRPAKIAGSKLPERRSTDGAAHHSVSVKQLFYMFFLS